MNPRIHPGGPPEDRHPIRMTGAFRFGLSLDGAFVIPLLSLLILAVLVLILSKTPARTLFFFLLGPFRNVYSFGNMLNGAVPLILGGLGVSIAMKAGSLNLGGEGQIYSGAFIATITAISLAQLGWVAGFCAIIAGAAAAGISAALSGICKVRWKTSELITTFLISNILILIINYLVSGPFLDPETSLLSTRKIALSLRLPLIMPPSSLSAAVFFALASVAAVQIFLSRTKLGYELRMAGANELFARYGGINTKINTVLSMFLSGAFYGLAGGLAILGTYYGTIKEFSAGLGWNGLAAALIARFSPPALIPASIFLAWIGSGARIAMQNSDITYEVAFIIQSVIFFLATSLSLRTAFKWKPRK
jgi:simple sugar transport system permease protein